jgi:dipeptidyl aminopeptidase/acylaminoacyl peptidase
MRRFALVGITALLIAAAAPARNDIPLETYLKLTDVAYISTSPDSSRIAYTSKESGTWQVWVMNFDGSDKRQVTNEKDGADFVQWVPDDPHTMLYSTSVGGSGVDQFYYVRDDRSGSTPLFPKETSVTHGNAVFSPDGSMLAFSSNARNASDNDVYVLHRDTGRVRRVYTVEGTAYATAWSPDGTKLLVRRVDTPYNDNLYVVDLKAGTSRLMTPHTGDANFDSSQFTPDMRGILSVSDLGSEFHSIQRIDMTTRAIRPLLGIPNDIDQVLLSPDGKTMAYIVNREGYGDVVVSDAATGRTIGTPTMPPYIAESLTFARGGRTLLYNASGPRFPKVMWAYDLDTHTTARLITPNFHGIPPGALVEPTIVHVRSFDGRMVPAWYFRPEHYSGKLTVLLDMHGGPEEQDRAWDYPFAQYLVSRGYGLLDPNVRGSTGYGRTYLHLADGRKREDAVKDVEALRKWLVTSGGADPKSIFIDGASYGGYLVLSSLYNYPHAYAGGMDVYGVADWVDFLEKTAPYRRANREGVYGSLKTDRAFLASISPINHVAQIKSPVLIAAGKNDTIVPVEQDERMAAALKRDGVPVELHIFPNEGHGFNHLANLIELYKLEAAFMQRYGAKTRV